MNLAILKAMGFDLSCHIPFTRRYRVGCSHCQALSICGVPAHEHGCPNQKHECRGCSNIISHKGYCADCS